MVSRLVFTYRQKKCLSYLSPLNKFTITIFKGAINRKGGYLPGNVAIKKSAIQIQKKGGYLPGNY